MDDPPFDLSRFDPSTLDLSHLHPGEQNRIRARQFSAQELSLLLARQNPWAKSGKPAPLPTTEPFPRQEPSLDDLRRIAHADTLPLLERGDLHVREALEAEWKRRQEPSPSLKDLTAQDDPEPEGTRYIRQARSATPKERADAELRRFMPDQVRAEYEMADADKRTVIWGANKRAFELAKKRKEERLRREQERTEKALDLLQTLKEDPTKAHLLPAADASLSDLCKWYDEMQKPVRTIPFPGLNQEHIRSDWRSMKDADKTRQQLGKSINSPRLKVFLCHSSNDKAEVRSLYQRLQQDEVEPWLDEEDLLAGQDWDYEITKAVRNSHVVVVCLSCSSIQKSGYVQKEIKHALDVADEQPEGTIFVIPLKLEECEIPERLRRWHWVNYFEEAGYERLIKALRRRAESLGKSLGSTGKGGAVSVVPKERRESTAPPKPDQTQQILVPVIESYRTSADNLGGIDYYSFVVSIRNDGEKTVRNFRLEVEMPNAYADPTHQGSMSENIRRVKGDVTIYRHTQEQFPGFVLYPKDVSGVLMNTNYQMRFDQYHDASGSIRVSVYSDDDLLGKGEYSIREHRNKDRMAQLGLSPIN